jgi:hypothetical protein
MKSRMTGLGVIGLMLLACGVRAAVYYVNAGNPAPAAPYNTWASAATNIQDAVNSAGTGDTVLVTNGIYAYGGKSIDGIITNRVSLDKAILVQSVNGPGPTIIQGAWDPTSTNGPGAVRCAWLTNNAILSGFTLTGGATREAYPNQTMEGGGVYGNSITATLSNCVITGNFAYYQGGGAFSATLNDCKITGNDAFGSGMAGAGGAGAGSGGGAANCNLMNCTVTSNYAVQANGGGALNCNATNCAFAKNHAPLLGSAAYSGNLVNCTLNNNTSGPFGSYGGAAAYATLVNCIVYGNLNIGYGVTNYVSCTFSYSDADPLPAGTGNVDVNPQLLGDNIHLAATSPCIGIGNNNIVSGVDIDGQPWGNPPSIGCDEWQPALLVCGPPVYLFNSPAHGLTCTVIVAGQSPFSYIWSFNGTPIQDNGHYTNSSTASLIVNNFGPDDNGSYQVVVSNAFGIATGQVAVVVIHAVNAGGTNPVAPYTTWATAATNIQDAINVAALGDIVLVTNGVYASGGKALAGGMTNVVTLDRAVTVQSVNGYASTIIQGMWDPVSTNGPGAVRCAYLGDPGAMLIGFTLRNGATQATGDSSGGPLTSGGGILCNSTNGIVANCYLTNNCAINGGGIYGGNLNNSYVVLNTAYGYGGGACYTTLHNCTVVYNYDNTPNISGLYGAGIFGGTVWNSIIFYNYDYAPPFNQIVADNYGGTIDAGLIYYSCTSPTITVGGGHNDINAYPQFPDSLHLATNSPCRGAGSALYASGTDLDGEPWANPPSMGCEEVVVSNLVGPLLLNLVSYQTNVLVKHAGSFAGFYTGHASASAWLFGDGQSVTNIGPVSHTWTNSGNYTVTYTVYNNDNPAGVSSNTIIHVQPPNGPQLQSAVQLTNGFQFQFAGQSTANFTVQYATNLMRPVSWKTLQTVSNSTGGIIQIIDPGATNPARFYQVTAQ